MEVTIEIRAGENTLKIGLLKLNVAEFRKICEKWSLELSERSLVTLKEFRPSYESEKLKGGAESSEIS